MEKCDLIKRHYKEALEIGIPEPFLWALVPNNTKRRYGFKSSRKIVGTRKNQIKPILWWGNRRLIYGIIEDTIEKQMRSLIAESIKDFTDIKSINFGIPSLYTREVNHG
jgi:hypothetical protein